MSDELPEVVREAERIVWVAGWRLQEQAVIGCLAGTVGLACAPLGERSEVIQLGSYRSAAAAAEAVAAACGKSGTGTR